MGYKVLNSLGPLQALCKFIFIVIGCHASMNNDGEDITTLTEYLKPFLGTQGGGWTTHQTILEAERKFHCTSCHLQTFKFRVHGE